MGSVGGIHPKLTSLIKDLNEGNRVRVAGQGVQSEWFCICICLA